MHHSCKRPLLLLYMTTVHGIELQRSTAVSISYEGARPPYLNSLSMAMQPEEEPEELIAARSKLNSATLTQQENESAGKHIHKQYLCRFKCCVAQQMAQLGDKCCYPAEECISCQHVCLLADQ